MSGTQGSGKYVRTYNLVFVTNKLGAGQAVINPAKEMNTIFKH